MAGAFQIAIPNSGPFKKGLRAGHCRGPVTGLLDLHAFDETIAERVRMMDDGIREKVARAIVHHLMDFNNGAVWLAGLDPHRIDVGIEDGPLAGQVGADFIVSVDTAAFHAVGPIDVGLHAGQHGVDAARIEITVGTGKQVALIAFYG